MHKQAQVNKSQPVNFGSWSSSQKSARSRDFQVKAISKYNVDILAIAELL